MRILFKLTFSVVEGKVSGLSPSFPCKWFFSASKWFSLFRSLPLSSANITWKKVIAFNVSCDNKYQVAVNTKGQMISGDSQCRVTFNIRWQSPITLWMLSDSATWQSMPSDSQCQMTVNAKWQSMSNDSQYQVTVNAKW